ncbi:hypothetical protein AB0K00_36550 [Dactylosporangium sp. NPDC049525]|uniref:hypothetical protein n=1 Tax=Dactylosporangium sp. NPDC049525 TaxID=3154730 RepID=UPI00341E4049
MRAALLLVGLAVTGYGAYGWLTQDGAQPLGQLIFLGVLLVTHDFVIVPAVILTGVVLVRWVPGTARNPVRVALAVSAAVTVVALPFIVGAGRIADNPSAFPQSYGRGLAVILAVVWATAAAWTAVNMRRKR